MTDIDNTIHFSDDDDMSRTDKDETFKCKGCESDFSLDDKGCSALKELCAKCHAKENADLLAGIDESDDELVGK